VANCRKLVYVIRTERSLVKNFTNMVTAQSRRSIRPASPTSGHRNGLTPSSLVTKIHSGSSNGFSALLAIIGGTNAGKVFLAMGDSNQQTSRSSGGQVCGLGTCFSVCAASAGFNVGNGATSGHTQRVVRQATIFLPVRPAASQITIFYTLGQYCSRPG
jgi:hypothetical protein